jgi:four helix bundle protein
MEDRPYQKLISWQEAHKLCLWVYIVTKSFPVEERFRLVNQMCRSAYSVSTNIAEGNARRSNKDKAHFFEISLASLEELHYQCLLSKDMKYLTPAQFSEANDKICRVSYLVSRLRAAFL